MRSFEQSPGFRRFDEEPEAPSYVAEPVAAPIAPAAPAAPARSRATGMTPDIAQAIRFGAEKFGVDEAVLVGMGDIESIGYNPDVISGKRLSPRGAIGMMQFMPDTAKRFGIDPRDPAQSAIGAAAYMRAHLDMFDGDYDKAVAAYNWGEGAVQKAVAKWGDKWLDHAPEETRKYVAFIRDFRSQATPQDPAKLELPEGVKPSEAGGGRGMMVEEPGARAASLESASSDKGQIQLDEPVFDPVTGVQISGRNPAEYRSVMEGVTDGKGLPPPMRSPFQPGVNPTVQRARAVDPLTGKAKAAEVMRDVAGNAKAYEAQTTGRAARDVEIGLAGLETTASGMTAVAQQGLLNKSRDRLAQLESAGQGDGPEAQAERKRIAIYESRMPIAAQGVADAAKRSAEAGKWQAGVIKDMGNAKTWGEAGAAFMRDPVGAILSVTLQSLPQILPGMAAGALGGAAVGVAATGASSFMSEATSGLAEYLQKQGVNAQNPTAVAKFFSDKDALRDGLDYALKGAVPVAALDALSMGMASKMMVPRALLPGRAAREVANIPVQVAAQGAAGGGGEAAKQMLQEGRIDKPGQVLAEVVGEMGSTPGDIIAARRDIFDLATGKTEPAPERKEPTLSFGSETTRAAGLPDVVVPNGPAPTQVDDRKEPTVSSRLPKMPGQEAEQPPAQSPAADVAGAAQEPAPLAPAPNVQSPAADATGVDLASQAPLPSAPNVEPRGIEPSVTTPSGGVTDIVGRQTVQTGPALTTTPPAPQVQPGRSLTGAVQQTDIGNPMSPQQAALLKEAPIPGVSQPPVRAGIPEVEPTSSRPALLDGSYTGDVLAAPEQPFANKSQANLFRDKNQLKGWEAAPIANGWVLRPTSLEPTIGELRHGGQAVAKLQGIQIRGAAPFAGVTLADALPADTGRAFGVARVAARAAGINIVPVNGLAADGIYVDNQPDSVFVAADSEKPVLFVAGHETYHAIKRLGGSVVGEFEQAVSAYLNPEQVNARQAEEAAAGLPGQKIPEGLGREEVVADVTGAMWLDPKFWREVMLRSPDLFQKVSAAFMEAATKIRAALTRNPSPEAKQFVSDVDAVRKLTAQMWVDRKKPASQSENANSRNAGEPENRGIKPQTPPENTAIPSGESNPGQPQNAQADKKGAVAAPTQAAEDVAGDLTEDEQADLQAELEAEMAGPGVSGEVGPDGEVYFSKRKIDPIPTKIQLSKDELALSDLEILYGKGANGEKKSVREAAQLLQDRAIAALEKLGIAPGDLTDPKLQALASKIIAAEIEVALRKPGNAADWYSNKLVGTMAVASLIHPELRSDAKSRVAFLIALAVTSQNMAVPDNLSHSEGQYAAWKSTGEFPIRGWGTGAKAMRTNFARANALMKEYPAERLERFLNSTFTVGELSAVGWEVSGENVDTIVYGSAVFGPKIGNGFYQNISGNFNPLTMDMWYMRGIGRITGNLISGSQEEFGRLKDKFLATATDIDFSGLEPSADFAEEHGIDEFTEENIKDDDVATELAKRVDSWFNKEFKKYRDQYDSGERSKPAIVNAAQRLIEQGGTNDVPVSGAHRNNLRKIFSGALKLLEDSGVPLTNADGQAIWWFPEKELYARLGAGNKKSAPTDYEREMIGIAKKRGFTDEQIKAEIGRARQRKRRSDKAGANGQGTGPVGGPSKQFTAAERSEFIRQRALDAYRGSAAAYGRGAGDGKSVRLLVAGKKIPVVAVWKPEKKPANRLNAVGIATPTVYEISPQDAGFFHGAISALKNGNKWAAAVHVYDQAEYGKMRLFLTQDAKAGFALKGDDVVSVFSTQKDGAAHSMLALAVQEGGRRLDAFDTVLPKIYALNGFVATSRTAWNDEYAPPGWSKALFASFNKGQPDVVYMAYSPAQSQLHTPESGKLMDYDAALAAQQAAVDNGGTNATKEPTIFRSARASGSAEPPVRSGGGGSAGARSGGQDARGWSKRSPQPGSVTVEGWHYGKAKVPALSGVMYGSGIKGAEADRLATSRDRRIKSRVYFYINRDDGTPPPKEDGLGPHKYEQRLSNLYDPSTGDPRIPLIRNGMNEFESAILDAGYDGYIAPRFGMAVVMDATVPANYVGEDKVGPAQITTPVSQRAKKSLMSREIFEVEPLVPQLQKVDPTLKFESGRVTYDPAAKDALNAEMARAGTGIRFSRRQTETPEFKRWFGKSTIVNEDGSPKVMYHGTARDIDAFRAKQAGAIFVTDSPRFAEAFADSSVAWMAENYKDILTPDQIDTAMLAAELDIKREYGDRSAITKRLLNHLRSATPSGEALGFFTKRMMDEMPSGANLMPLYVKAENPFDYENPAHVQALDDHGLISQPAIAEIMIGTWSEIEKPYIQDYLKELGHDGFYVREGGEKNLAVYSPTQLKSATGNRGTFDPDNPDLRMSRRPKPPPGGFSIPAPAGRFTLDPESEYMRNRRIVQDRFIRLREVQKMIAEQGGLLNDNTDAYLAEERSHGRVAFAIDEFKDKWMRPFTEKAAKVGIDLDELSLYAYAKHAEERNRHIASINPGLPDGGSGMKTADAQAIIARFQAQPNFQDIRDLHNDLMAVTQASRDLLWNEGLISDDEYTAWSNQYSDYIPLRGFEGVDPETGVRTGGRGINVRGGESMRALGRRSKAGNLIENVIADYERAVLRAEKNEIGRTFYRFVQANPDSKLWEVDPVKRTRKYDPTKHLVVSSLVEDVGPDTIAFKEDGKEVHIKIHDEALLRTMRASYMDETGQFQRVAAETLGVFNGYLRNTLTRWNPGFVVINTARDFQTANASVVDKLGFGALAKYNLHVASAAAVAWRNERGTLVPGGGWDKWMTEFRAAGGATGGFFGRDVERIASDLRGMLIDAGATVQPKGSTATAKAIDRAVIALRGNRAAKVAAATAKLVESMGGMSENMFRVAAYRTAREMGKSPAQAASIAKNLTTNFDRRGEVGLFLNSAYLFFNASLQGAVRTLQYAKNPKMAAVAAAGVALGLTAAMLGADAGEEDGESYWDMIPDYIKERNLVIMLPPSEDKTLTGERIGKKGRYIKIPLAYGLNFLPVLGYGLADSFRHAQDPSKGRKSLTSAARVANAFLGSYNPLGGGVPKSVDEAWLMALPTVADIPYTLTQEIDSFGRKAAPEKTRKEEPDSERAFMSDRGTAQHRVARWLNQATGGNKAQSGAIDITPATIEGAVRYATGGTGTFIMDVLSTAGQALGEEKVKSQNVPFLKALYGEVDSKAIIRDFYENRDEIEKSYAQLMAATKMGVPIPKSKQNDALYELGGYLQGIQKGLTELRKWEVDAVSREMSEDPEARKSGKADRERVEAEKAKLMRAFNKHYRKTWGAAE